MKTFIVLSLADNADNKSDLIAIGDRFSRLAAIAPVLWFLWRGMWPHALLSFIAIGLLLSLALTSTISVSVVLLFLVLAIWFGLEANNFHIMFLEKQGYKQVEILSAPDADCAKDIYLASKSSGVDKLPSLSQAKRTAIVPPKNNPPQADLIFGEN